MGLGVEEFKRHFKVFLITMAAWYAVVIAAFIVLMVLDRLASAAVVVVAGVVLSLGYGAVFSRWARQAKIGLMVAEGGAVTWLPPADARRPAGFDLDVETERLGDYGTRAWIFAVLLGAAGVALVVTIGILQPGPRFWSGDSPLWLGLVLAAAIIAAGFFLAASLGWRKRQVAVVASGWRRAEALTRLSTDRYSTSKVSIRYDDFSRIVLLPVPTTHVVLRRARTAPQEVWVGGADRAMVVLFPPVERDGWPYAVPMKAREPRTTTR